MSRIPGWRQIAVRAESLEVGPELAPPPPPEQAAASRLAPVRATASRLWLAEKRRIV
jgi:hypothetical protein